jgi:hypothetical protein
MENKNKEALDQFVLYCKEHPELRFLARFEGVERCLLYPVGVVME